MAFVEQQRPQMTLFSGSLFSAAGMVLGGLLSIATGMVLGRWLGPDGFGTYSVVIITITVAGGIGTFGFDNCTARFAALYLGNREVHKIQGLVRYAFLRVLVFSLASATGLFLIMHTGFLNGTRLTSLAYYSGLLVFGIPLYALQLTLLQGVLGLQRIKSRIILEKALQPTLRLALPFAVFVWVRVPTSAAVWGLVISALLVDLVGGLQLRAEVRRFPETSKIDNEEKKEWRSFALPFVFYSLQNFLWAGMGLDVFLVGALISMHDAGIYAAALRLIPVLALARGAMDYSFGPKVGVLFGQSDFKSIGVLYRSTSAMALSWMLPVAVVLAVFSRPIMRTFFGPGYESGALVLTLLAAGYVVDGATGCNLTLLAMAGRSRLVLVNGIVGGLVLLFLGVLLIPRWGIAGAGFATACSTIVVNVLATLEIWRLFSLQPFGSKVAKVVAAGAVVAAFGLAWKGWILPMLQPGVSALAISACVVLVAYFALLFATTKNFQILYIGEAE